MSRLGKLIRQTPGNQWYLVKTLALMTAIKLGLAVLSLPQLQRLLDRPVRPVNRLLDRPQRPVKPAATTEVYRLRRVQEAVEITGRHVPYTATCLVKALTAQTLLRQAGLPAEMHIGVKRAAMNQRAAVNQPAGLDAHAWVVSQGKVVVGSRSDLHLYRPFPGLQEKLR